MSGGRDDRAHDAFTHGPLPYIIRLRVSIDDDAPPQIREFHITAYSVIEAVFQAIFEAGGTELNDAKTMVDSVRPDEPAFYALVHRTAAGINT